MLPSMPILFSRDSQDAFGNKIVPSTSFFGQTSFAKPATEPLPPPPKPPPKPEKSRGKGGGKKKEPILDEPSQTEDLDKDTVFATKYFSKVQSRFASTSRVPNKKFIEFQELLKSFDIAKESPLDLYSKMVDFFGEGNKDLAEEFLMFLTPSQAAEIGRFMDHFLMSKMNSFILLLHSTFSRKPTMVRKVLRAITNSVSCGSLAEMRNKVLPHLRTSPRLAATFRALFPDEKPPDSLYEAGVDTIDQSFLSEPREYDVLRFQDAADSRRKLEPKERLDTMYLHGRVFLQHQRMLRPARVTYPYSKEPYRVLHSPRNNDKKITPKRNKKNNTKDVNGNNKPNIEKKPRAQPKTKKKDSEPTKRENKNRNEGPKAKLAKIEIDKKERKCDVDKEKKAEKRSDTDKKVKFEDKKTNADKKFTTDKKTDTTQKVTNKKSELDKHLEINKKQEESKSNNWTREEDKIMLQIMKSEAVSDQIFVRLKELLPQRSVTEIKDRFFHVMSLVQQMAIGDVA